MGISKEYPLDDCTVTLFVSKHPPGHPQRGQHDNGPPHQWIGIDGEWWHLGMGGPQFRDGKPFIAIAWLRECRCRADVEWLLSEIWCERESDRAARINGKK